MKRIIIVVALCLTGCVNFDQRIMLPDMTVKPIKTGYDCTHMIIVPIFIGTNTVAQAMANGGREEGTTVERTSPNGRTYSAHSRLWVADPITKVHSIDVQSWGMPFWSYSCLKVQGE